jgi:hypothetical protein
MLGSSWKGFPQQSGIVMQAITSDRSATRPNSTKNIITVVVMLVILLVVAVFANKAYQSLQPASLPQGTVTISERVLEAQYGLRVNLVAVTGAGGFIDIRLKMVDGEKAKLLLADAQNFPTPFAKSGVTLNAPADTKSQTIEFISGGNLFIMYPNAGNAVTQGSPVTIVFGDTALEPINAK